MLPVLGLAEVRRPRLAEVHDGVAQRVRRDRTVPEPPVRVLHAGHVRILGVRVRLPVVRVERLDLLVVGETPVAETPFQQRGLSPGRRERYALRHLAHGHCDSRSFDRWSSMYLATARSLTEPMLSAK